MRPSRGIKKVIVCVPEKFRMLFDNVAMFTGTKEFGAFFDYTETADYVNNTLTLTVTEFFELPQQKSSTGYFEIDPSQEAYIRKRYKGVIHRHPRGVRAFSGTDYECLNPGFVLSGIRIPEEDYWYWEVMPRIEVNGELAPLSVTIPVKETKILSSIQPSFTFEGRNLRFDEFQSAINDRVKPIQHVQPPANAGLYKGNPNKSDPVDAKTRFQFNNKSIPSKRGLTDAELIELARLEKEDAIRDSGNFFDEDPLSRFRLEEDDARDIPFDTETYIYPSNNEIETERKPFINNETLKNLKKVS